MSDKNDDTFSGIIALGPEMRHNSKPFRSTTENAMVFVREGIANAISFGANKFFFVIVNMSDDKLRPDPHIVIMHNGTAFEDLAAIMEKGLMLGVSQRTGNSLNGVGPKVASRNLSDNPVYGIASYCANGNFAAATGRPNFDKRRWDREDVTERIQKKFTKLIGKAFIDREFSVYYFCRIDTLDHSLFELRDSNTLGLWLDDMFTPSMDLKFAQIGIGFQEYRAKDGYQDDGDKVTARDLVTKYSSLDGPRNFAKARGKKSANDGMMRRDVPSHTEFRRRFCPDNHHLTIAVDNVKVVADQYPTREVSVNVEVSVEVYPGTAAEVSGHAGWMANVRDLDREKDGFGGVRGKGLDVGTVPNHRVFVRFSAMATDAGKIDEENARVHRRFATQPIHSASDELRYLTQKMRVPYAALSGRSSGTSGDPFIIVTFDITKVNYVKTYDGEGNSERENQKAFYLDSLIHVGSDFFAREPLLLRKIGEAACEKIVVDDSPNYRRVRALCESYWPKPPEQWLNPYEDMGIEQTKRGQQAVKVIDLETGEVSDKIMHADKDHYYVIYDARTGRGIDPRSINFSGGTRGATIDDASKALKQRDKKTVAENFAAVKESLDPTGNMGIKPIVVSVTGLQVLWEDEWVDWNDEELPEDLEWERNNAAFQPSPTICLDYKGMAVLIGKVEEVPAAKERPPTTKKVVKGKAKKKRELSRSGRAGQMDPFINDNPNIMFRYDTKFNVVLWNRQHPDVTRYFNPKGLAATNEYKDRLREFASRANAMAKRVQGFLNNDQFPINPPDVGRSEVPYGDFDTFAMHMIVVPYLRDDEGIRNLRSHMDREIDSLTPVAPLAEAVTE